MREVCSCSPVGGHTEFKSKRPFAVCGISKASCSSSMPSSCDDLETYFLCRILYYCRRRRRRRRAVP